MIREGVKQKTCFQIEMLKTADDTYILVGHARTFKEAVDWANALIDCEQAIKCRVSEIDMDADLEADLDWLDAPLS